MRKNLPITDTEYFMEDGRAIVSKTDLKGKITYVNPYFVEVSGFSEQELIGAPHNIVRHPDMPAEAFADLWQCLKAGLPWSGMVKNRRKNGDFYWVWANVTPLMEAGRISGFMSVRNRPSRDQIAGANAAYRRMVAGNAERMAIRQGRVVTTGWRAASAAFINPPLQMRINLVLGVVIGLLLGLGWAALQANSGIVAGLIVGASLLGVACTLTLAFWLKRRMLAPLRIAIGAARTLAGGDLTVAIPAHHGDEFGQLLEAMQQMKVNLLSIVRDVRSNVQAMSSATAEIAGANMDLSARTEAQASGLQETAASMEQLSSTVQQTADNTLQANQLVDSASSVTAQGGEAVGQVGRTMSEISDSAKKIADITGLIDGIAFQTNILALNAAVEAARAGEQGKGFAVVASEVRSLAQRSALAARDIKGLIDDSVSKVEQGKRQVHDTGQTMNGVVDAVQRVQALMNEIANAAREQSSGIAQVNQAVADMDLSTQQNAAMVEQAAAAASQLDEQARQLSQAVSVFKLERATGLTERGDAWRE